MSLGLPSTQPSSTLTQTNNKISLFKIPLVHLIFLSPYLSGKTCRAIVTPSRTFKDVNLAHRVEAQLKIKTNPKIECMGVTLQKVSAMIRPNFKLFLLINPIIFIK